MVKILKNGNPIVVSFKIASNGIIYSDEISEQIEFLV
jgi:hypothetical protein